MRQKILVDENTIPLYVRYPLYRNEVYVLRSSISKVVIRPPLPPPPPKKREEKRPTLRCMYTGFKIMFACHLCRQTKLSYRDHLSMVSIKAWTNKLNVTGLWWWNSFREHFSGIKMSSMLLVDLVRPSFGYLGLTTFLYWFFN